MNSHGDLVIAPAPLVVEAIRKARITNVMGIRDKEGNQGAALISSGKLKLVLTSREMQSVADLLTLNEMEALFNKPEGKK